MNKNRRRKTDSAKKKESTHGDTRRMNQVNFQTGASTTAQACELMKTEYLVGECHRFDHKWKDVFFPQSL